MLFVLPAVHGSSTRSPSHQGIAKKSMTTIDSWDAARQTPVHLAAVMSRAGRTGCRRFVARRLVVACRALS